MGHGKGCSHIATPTLPAGVQLLREFALESRLAPVLAPGTQTNDGATVADRIYRRVIFLRYLHACSHDDG